MRACVGKIAQSAGKALRLDWLSARPGGSVKNEGHDRGVGLGGQQHLLTFEGQNLARRSCATQARFDGVDLDTAVDPYQI